MVDNQTLEKLIDASFAVKRNAYCPYSNFPVGAALLCPDGTIITGCNVENASYGIVVCAERTAICAAIARGYRKFSAIVISSDLKDSFISPCGNCRQTMIEFGSHLPVYMTKPDRSYILRTIGELVPLAFEPESMWEPRLNDEDPLQHDNNNTIHKSDLVPSSNCNGCHLADSITTS